MKLKAKFGCKICGGSGVITDWVPVPFGSGNCPMNSDCECLTEELDEETIEKIESGEIQTEVLPADGFYVNDWPEPEDLS